MKRRVAAATAPDRPADRKERPALFLRASADHHHQRREARGAGAVVTMQQQLGWARASAASAMPSRRSTSARIVRIPRCRANVGRVPRRIPRGNAQPRPRDARGTKSLSTVSPCNVL